MNLPWHWDSAGKNPNIRMCDIEEHRDIPWNWRNLSRRVCIPDEYIDCWLCKYSVLSMHDEDYGRGEECLDYKNVVDLVFQNEYILYILGYI